MINFETPEQFFARGGNIKTPKPKFPDKIEGLLTESDNTLAVPLHPVDCIIGQALRRGGFSLKYQPSSWWVGNAHIRITAAGWECTYSPSRNGTSVQAGNDLPGLGVILGKVILRKVAGTERRVRTQHKKQRNPAATSQVSTPSISAQNALMPTAPTGNTNQLRKGSAKQVVKELFNPVMTDKLTDAEPIRAEKGQADSSKVRMTIARAAGLRSGAGGRDFAFLKTQSTV